MFKACFRIRHLLHKKLFYGNIHSPAVQTQDYIKLEAYAYYIRVYADISINIMHMFITDK